MMLSFEIRSRSPSTRGELMHLLPAALSARLDWSTLALSPSSHVDEALADSQSDLLFTIQLDPKQRVLPALAAVLKQEQKKDMVSIADQLIEEGMQQGMQQATLPELEQWADRVLTATTLAEVVGTPSK